MEEIVKDMKNRMDGFEEKMSEVVAMEKENARKLDICNVIWTIINILGTIGLVWVINLAQTILISCIKGGKTHGIKQKHS